jgi:hypothetical protein
MEYILIYIVCCIPVAVLGRNRKMGFWGYLFFSILLTPVVGLITILASDSRQVRKVSPVPPDAVLANESSDKAARTYMQRIDRLVASHRITREYASHELVPLLVRDARRIAGDRGLRGACPLDTILGALEALPSPAAAPVQSGPPGQSAVLPPASTSS